MTAPADFLSEFALRGKSPEEQEAMLQERAKNLKRQRSWAVLSMLGTPEMQEAGRAQFGEASRQQGAMEQLAPRVLRQALAEKELGLRGQELALQTKKLGFDMVMPLIPGLIQATGDIEFRKALLGHLGALGKWAEDLVNAKPQAQKRALEHMMDALPRMVEGAGAGGAPGLPTPVAPAPVVPAPISAPARIRVRNKETGEEGMLKAHKFDPTKWEKLPSP